MTRAQLTAAFAALAVIAVLGCTMTWAAPVEGAGMHERFLENDVPEAVRRMRADMRELYTQLPAEGIDGPFHGGITIALAVLGALAASLGARRT